MGRRLHYSPEMESLADSGSLLPADMRMIIVTLCDAMVRGGCDPEIMAFIRSLRLVDDDKLKTLFLHFNDTLRDQRANVESVPVTRSSGVAQSVTVGDIDRSVETVPVVSRKGSSDTNALDDSFSVSSSRLPTDNGNSLGS